MFLHAKLAKFIQFPRHTWDILFPCHASGRLHPRLWVETPIVQAGNSEKLWGFGPEFGQGKPQGEGRRLSYSQHHIYEIIWDHMISYLISFAQRGQPDNSWDIRHPSCWKHWDHFPIGTLLSATGWLLSWCGESAHNLRVQSVWLSWSSWLVQSMMVDGKG